METQFIELKNYGPNEENLDTAWDSFIEQILEQNADSASIIIPSQRGKNLQYKQFLREKLGVDQKTFDLLTTGETLLVELSPSKNIPLSISVLTKFNKRKTEVVWLIYVKKEEILKKDQSFFGPYELEMRTKPIVKKCIILPWNSEYSSKSPD